MGYASGTNVSVDKSEAEIKTLLRKHGATKFATKWEGTHSEVVFVCQNRLIQFRIPMPSQSEVERTPTGRKRNKKNVVELKLVEEERRRWRALVLCIKAKLEAVAEKIETFDEAFLSHIVTDDKRTVYERLIAKGASIKMLAPVSTDTSS